MTTSWFGDVNVRHSTLKTPTVSSSMVEIVLCFEPVVLLKGNFCTGLTFLLHRQHMIQGQLPTGVTDRKKSLYEIR